jgi:TPR repeat protein
MRLEKGEVVTKDLRLAAEYYKKAADQATPMRNAAMDESRRS